MGIDGATIKRKNKEDVKSDTKPIYLIGVCCLTVGLVALFNDVFWFFYLSIFSGVACFVAAFRVNKSNGPPRKVENISDNYLREETPPKNEKNWDEIFAALDRLFKNHADLISALVFVARADGQMRESERDIIIDICLDLSDYKQIPRHKLEFIIKDIRTSGINFKLLIEQFSSADKKSLKVLNEGVKKIIKTQKVISPGEQFCLDLLADHGAEK